MTSRRLVLLCAAWVHLPATAADLPVAGPRANRATLSARVTAKDGKPLRGATASIVEVEPRPGATAEGTTSVPRGLAEDGQRACLPDCGKHTLTDADGRFKIDGVDPAVQFKVRVEAKGYRGQSLVLDPRDAELSVNYRLTADHAPPADDGTGYHAQVLLPDGSPAVGVSVHRPLHGEHAKIQTDQNGRFYLDRGTVRQVAVVTVEAQGCVSGQVFSLKPGLAGNTLHLAAGASIGGRVLHKAKAVDGVTVLLISMPPQVGNRAPQAGGHLPPPATRDVVTDRDGRFVFDRLKPETIYQLLTPMSSMVDRKLGAIAREVRSPAGGRALEIGEVNLHAAHGVSGRIQFSDRDAPPGPMVAVLERFAVRDMQETLVDRDGSFAFEAVPSEPVVLSFHSWRQREVSGYRLSAENPSIDPFFHATLCGSVEEDRRLNVLFERGSTRSYWPGEMALKGAALTQGRVRAMGVRNGQLMRESGAIKLLREQQPLVGLSDNEIARLKVSKR